MPKRFWNRKTKADQLNPSVEKNQSWPRVQALRNTVLTDEQERELLIQPDLDIIRTISEQTNGRIGYLASKFVQLLPESQRNDPYAKMTPHDYRETTLDPAVEVIRQRHKTIQAIGLRVIATSINGPQPLRQLHRHGTLLDITETIKGGSEKPEEEVINVLQVDTRPDVKPQTTILMPYAFDAGVTRTRAEDPRNAEAIFPAVLTYDAEHLESDDTTNYGVRLKPEVKPEDAILGAYVLDCPIVLNVP